MRKLREALVKLVSVVGVPKPLEAVFSIADIEREEDKDYSFSRSVARDNRVFQPSRLTTDRENWHSGEENKKRGEN